MSSEIPLSSQKIQDRFENFERAFNVFSEIMEQREFSDLEKTGCILRFVFTLEMAWKLMQDVLEHEGNFDIKGVKDVIRVALQRGVITNGEIWMEMVDKRNQLAHGYDAVLAMKSFERIKKYFYPELQHIKDFVQKRYDLPTA